MPQYEEKFHFTQDIEREKNSFSRWSYKSKRLEKKYPNMAKCFSLKLHLMVWQKAILFLENNGDAIRIFIWFNYHELYQNPTKSF
jgi:hypothetical protein